MLAHIVRRMYYAVLTLVIVSVLSFILINLPPGSYLDVYRAELQAMGTSTAEKQIESLKKRYKLGAPIYVQYWRWITGFVQGDFGRSFQYNRPVGELIWERLSLTIAIALGTLIFTWAVALPIGIYSAVHQYTLGDNLFTLIGFLGLSIPNFLLALAIMVVAAIFFGQSVGGLFSEQYVDAPWSLGKFVDMLKHLWIPVIVVGTARTASLIRIMRGNLLDILNKHYVQTARAKGLKERIVIYKHAVRNALHPLIMQLGLALPAILSGSTVVAIVLSLPTMGPLYFNALRSQDMFLAGTFLMFMSALLIFGNLFADILLAWVDPRIRYE